MKTNSFIFVLIFVMGAFAQNSGIHGDIQIQGVKSIWGTDDNFDQLYGRANLKWSFREDSTFSSLIHIRAYPAGFGYENLLGASFLPENTEKFRVPAVPNRRPDTVSSGQPTIQIYQAWIRYKFPDFDLRVGRMTTENTKSYHFGNYLDFPAGGTFTLSREGVHNALEGYKTYGVFDTRAHIGVGDMIGNRGFLRVYETLSASENLKLGIGYRANLFDLVYYSVNDPDVKITHRAALSIDYQIHTDVGIYIESGWRHTRSDDVRDPVPVLLSVTYNIPEKLKSYLKRKLYILDVLDIFKAECEYLYDRQAYNNNYKNVDMDILWNLYGEKTWLKRMTFQGGLFAAPKTNRTENVGIGFRFTSKIN